MATLPVDGGHVICRRPCTIDTVPTGGPSITEHRATYAAGVYEQELSARALALMARFALDDAAVTTELLRECSPCRPPPDDASLPMRVHAMVPAGPTISAALFGALFDDVWDGRVQAWLGLGGVTSATCKFIERPNDDGIGHTTCLDVQYEGPVRPVA